MNLVVKTALENRLDLMNQKAQLVDSWHCKPAQPWRPTALHSGVFNVEYNLNATTPPNGSTPNPLAFSTANTQHQLIFNAQLPLVRIVERNQYRSTLIAYQQQRLGLDGFPRPGRLRGAASRFAICESRRLTITAVQKRQMELAYLVVDQSLPGLCFQLAGSDLGPRRPDQHRLTFSSAADADR